LQQGIDAGTEARYIHRGLAALGKVGVEPVGYRAPWWELNWHSPALLADRGFLYDSSLLDGDAPYRFAVAEGDHRDIVEIPVDWTLDDWEQYAFYPGVTGSGVIERPAKVLEMWTLEAEAHHAQGSCFVLINQGGDRRAHPPDSPGSSHPRQDQSFLLPGHGGKVHAGCRSPAQSGRYARPVTAASQAGLHNPAYKKRRRRQSPVAVGVSCVSWTVRRIPRRARV
jgi:hypothetical protein